MVKNLPAMQEIRVQSLGREDALEKSMAIDSSVLAWRIPGQRSLADCSPWGGKKSDTAEWLAHTRGQLSMLWQFQGNSKGTQPHIYMYSFSPPTSAHQGCHLTLLLPLVNCKELPFALWVPIPRPCRDQRPHKHTLITFTERGEEKIGKGKQTKVTHAQRKRLSLQPRIFFLPSQFPCLCKMMGSRWDCAMLETRDFHQVTRPPQTCSPTLKK